jgi:hypothetical protein
MHNPFLTDTKHRITSWKNLREQIQQAEHVDHKLDLTLSWWKQAPLQNRVLDWDHAHTWPDPWQLLHDNEYCASAHSLGVAHTLMLADPITFPNVQLKLLWDKPNSLQRIVAHTHTYYLNWGHVDKTPQDVLQHVWIQNIWEYHNKQWRSIRPK